MVTKPLTTTRAFRGTNFVTPNVDCYLAGRLKNGEGAHVEISYENPPYFSRMVGGDPNGGPMWGVTVKHPDGRDFEPDLSSSFPDRESAMAYIKSL